MSTQEPTPQPAPEQSADLTLDATTVADLEPQVRAEAVRGGGRSGPPGRGGAGGAPVPGCI